LRCSLFDASSEPAWTIPGEPSNDPAMIDECPNLLFAVAHGLTSTLTQSLAQFSSKADLVIHDAMFLHRFSLLYGAAQNGHCNVCKFLIDDFRHKVDYGSIWGDTPLQVATMRGHLPVVKLLLDRGARVDYLCIELAAMNNHENCLQALILAFAPDANVLDKSLELACIYQCRQTYEYLERARISSRLDLAAEAMNLVELEKIIQSTSQLNICQALQSLSRSPQKNSQIQTYRKARALLVEATKQNQCLCVECGKEKL